VAKNSRKGQRILSKFPSKTPLKKWKTESNGRYIEWEDGTISLVIGDKFFDLKADNNDTCLYIGHKVYISFGFNI